MRASRDLGHPQVGVSAARDLAQRRGFDRRRGTRRTACALALNVAPLIHCKSSVAEYFSGLDAVRCGRYRYM